MRANVRPFTSAPGESSIFSRLPNPLQLQLFLAASAQSQNLFEISALPRSRTQVKQSPMRQDSLQIVFN